MRLHEIDDNVIGRGRFGPQSADGAVHTTYRLPMSEDIDLRARQYCVHVLFEHRESLQYEFDERAKWEDSVYMWAQLEGVHTDNFENPTELQIPFEVAPLPNGDGQVAVNYVTNLLSAAAEAVLKVSIQRFQNK